MASIAIVGRTGTGKSTAVGQIPELNIEGLPPDKTAIINVAGKDLPFRGWKSKYTGDLSKGGNYLHSASATVISQAIDYVSSKRDDLEYIVVEDAQFIMAFEFMDRAKEVGYGKFTDIGVNISKVFKSARRSPKHVFFLWHPEFDEQDGYKMKTVGKMVTSYFTPEGLFTIVLYTDVKRSDNETEYRFVTNHDGTYPAKSPVGMFPLYIPNDLGYVVNKINEYNNG